MFVLGAILLHARLMDNALPVFFDWLTSPEVKDMSMHSAYVRHGEKVLIMKRSDEVADFFGAGGRAGVGDPEDIDAHD